jgi:DNA (cytosine-5)-methyltransferase 1
MNHSKRRESRQLTAIDLFSGPGGLTLGLKQAGFRVLGAIDVDELAVKTYKRNHRKVNVWQRDISQISVLSVKRKLHLRKGDLDLLAGCPPCQGFSSLRTLNGGKVIQDDRNDLVFQFLRFVEELAPKTIMLENVPGLATDSRLKKFCRRLKKLGYDVHVDILDAANFGVPQRRRRLILLAGKSGPIKPAAEAGVRVTVRSSIGGMRDPGTGNDPLHDRRDRRSAAVMERIKLIPKNGGSRKDLGPKFQLPCHKKSDGFSDIYGRMRWEDVAPTITSGCGNPSKGRFLHPEKDRAITLREAALLQTFPDRYYFSMEKGKDAAAAMIGNALPPEFIRRHVCSVRAHLRHFDRAREHGTHRRSRRFKSSRKRRPGRSRAR